MTKYAGRNHNCAKAADDGKLRSAEKQTWQNLCYNSRHSPHYFPTLCELNFAPQSPKVQGYLEHYCPPGETGQKSWLHKPSFHTNKTPWFSPRIDEHWNSQYTCKRNASPNSQRFYNGLHISKCEKLDEKRSVCRWIFSNLESNKHQQTSCNVPNFILRGGITQKLTRDAGRLSIGN